MISWWKAYGDYGAGEYSKTKPVNRCNFCTVLSIREREVMFMNDYKSIFYVGSYSITFMLWNLTGKRKASILNRVEHCNKPSYLCMDSERNYLYANNEIVKGRGGLSSYSIKDKLNPKHINSISFNAPGPCHVSISEDQRTIFSASYAEGKVYANSINEDGSLGVLLLLSARKRGYAAGENCSWKPVPGARPFYSSGARNQVCTCY